MKPNFTHWTLNCISPQDLFRHAVAVINNRRRRCYLRCDASQNRDCCTSCPQKLKVTSVEDTLPHSTLNAQPDSRGRWVTLGQTPGCIWHPAGYSGWDPWAAMTSPLLCHGPERKERKINCSSVTFLLLSYSPVTQISCFNPKWTEQPPLMTTGRTGGHHGRGRPVKMNTLDVTAPAWLLYMLKITSAPSPAVFPWQSLTK